MKHVTYGEKAHFLDDAAATALLEYASALGNASASDTVTVQAVDLHGNRVEATFLLNPSTELMMESASGQVAELDNSAVVEHMRAAIARLTDPPEIEPESRRPIGDDGHVGLA
ncbi:hypothetical protein [Microbacterium sp. 179-I 3D4 NHS]|uniref:hypothetical protein n=1 Tax=Microbacterium sp. 179-I 3D4 NHS TaxID=3142381 RepID=UPI0039A2EAFF